MYFSLFVGALCLSFYWYAFLYVLSSFTILLTRKRKLAAFALIGLMMSCDCYIYSVLWRFLAMLWVGLQCVIIVFPDHTHFLKRIF